MSKNVVSILVIVSFILAILGNGIAMAADSFKGVNFDNDKGQEEWELSEGVNGKVIDGTLNLEFDKSYASVIVKKLEIFAPVYKFLKIRMKNNTGQHVMKLYWTEKEEVWSDEKSTDFDVNRYEDDYTDYVIKLGEIKTWDNTIRQIKLEYNNQNQSGNQEGVKSISIDSLEFVASMSEKMPITDEEMFGVWKDGKWDVQGKINYEYSSNLKGIGEIVKNGEYQTARDRSRFYFAPNIIQDESKLNEDGNKIVDLIQRNIILGEKDWDTYIGKYSLGKDDSINIDLVDLVSRQYQSGKQMVLMLMCPDSEGYVILDTSKNKCGPELNIKVDSQQYKLEPLWEAGIDIESSVGNKNKNDKEYKIREGKSNGDAYSRGKRAFLAFDLSSLPQGVIGEAKLYVHGIGYGGWDNVGRGRNSLMGDMVYYQRGDYIEGPFYLFAVPADRLVCTDTQIKVNDFIAYYWGAERSDIDWKYERYSQKMFNFWFVEPLMKQYTAVCKENNDKNEDDAYIEKKINEEKKVSKERYLDQMIKTMETFTYQIGGVTPLHPSITEADSRVRRWIAAYDFLQKNNYLDSNANMALLQYIWKTGHQLEREIGMNAYGTEEEIIAKGMLKTIAENFPLFIDSEKWKTIAGGSKTQVSPVQESLAETSKIGDAVAVCVDQPKAYVGKKIVEIDETNKAVTPIVKNNRTLVPIRFISEAFGALVQWDDDTSTATIIVNNKAVKIQLNSNKMEIDGGEVLLDTPAESINERIYIPLRKLTEEVLGKKVFYENGLIVISDIENILNKDDDMKFIKKMVDMLR